MFKDQMIKNLLQLIQFLSATINCLMVLKTFLKSASEIH